MRPRVAADAPDFVARVTGMILAGRGDLLPVSALPVDGTFPTGTAQYEKRNISAKIPIWEPDICIDCGLCALVCPHAAIRIKRYDANALGDAPGDFLSLQKSSAVLNAEFGFGLRLALDSQRGRAQYLLELLAGQLDTELVEQTIASAPYSETQYAEQRDRISRLKTQLQGIADTAAVSER